MTAALISAPQHTRLRLTVRGRRALATLAALPIAAGILVGVIGGGEALATRDVGSAEASFLRVTVEPGDSLWSVAQRVAPGSDPRDVVDALTQLNALESSTVGAGQVLAVPAHYAP